MAGRVFRLVVFLQPVAVSADLDDVSVMKEPVEHCRCVWKKACRKLGIEGVDLCGGTRNSTMRFRRRDACLSPEEVSRASLHRTNKALDRHIEIGLSEIRDAAALTRTAAAASEKASARPS